MSMKFSTGGPVPRMFTVELEGVTFQAKDIKGVLNQYRRWKELRGERLAPDWNQEVWLALAKAHPKFVKVVKTPAGPGVSLAAALSFLGYLMRRKLSKTLVSPVEAERRAAICRACPLGEPVLGCSVCKDALSPLVNQPYLLKVPEGCGACGCWLPAKCWIPREHLGGAEEFPFAPGCWMRE